MPKEAMRESLRPRIDEARDTLRTYEPEKLAWRGGLELSENRLALTLLGAAYYILLPDLVATFADGAICPEEIQILFLDYLVQGDGTPPSGQWIGFQELPNGMFYRKAFQGYSGDQLVHDLSAKIDAFRDAATSLGGEPVELGDAAYAFRVLPNVPLAVVWWNGDDEFPANGTVLFDASTSHYLPTDGLAIVGRMLCRKLAKLGVAK